MESASWSPCELVRLSSWEPDLGSWQIPQGPDPMGVHLGGCQPACPDHTPSLLPGLTAPHLQAVLVPQETAWHRAWLPVTPNKGQGLLRPPRTYVPHAQK